MKKLGLIGGTGMESTLIYYKELNSRLEILSGKTAFPEIAIESIDLYKTSAFMRNEAYDELEAYLLGRFNNLINGGAEIVALTAGTMHVVYDSLKEKITVPFISIPETAAEDAVKKGYHKVGLFGTIFTMEKDYLRKSFEKRGIEVFTPEKEDRDMVHDIIFSELEYGIVKAESVKKLVDVIEKMKKEQGIEAIILGCTELPLALNNDNSPVPCIDIMGLHIDRLCDLIKD